MKSTDKEKSIIFLSERAHHTFDEEWYDYAKVGHFWVIWRFQAICRFLIRLEIPLQKSICILDVGSGSGVFRDQIEAVTFWNVDCADLSLDALKRASTGRGQNLYYNVLEERPELAGVYDGILLLDVLEHVENTQKFLQSVLYHLKPGGFILVSVPALQSFYSAYDEAIGHVRRYNKESLGAEFIGLGISRVQTVYWGLTLLPLLALRTLILKTLPHHCSVVKDGFKPPSELINRIMVFVANLEVRLLRNPLSGTSVLLAGTKD